VLELSCSLLSKIIEIKGSGAQGISVHWGGTEEEPCNESPREEEKQGAFHKQRRLASEECVTLSPNRGTIDAVDKTNDQHYEKGVPENVHNLPLGSNVHANHSFKPGRETARVGR
jgi:hypothetical protein